MTHIIDTLIGISSVSGNEANIAQFIFGYLKTLKASPVWVGQNVVICIPGVSRDAALIFNAHLDTVPPGDDKQWSSSPYKAVHKKGNVYGLGASDEKAAVAALLLLAQNFTKAQPACDVWLTFVVNEEVDGSGSAKVVDWFVKNHKTKYKKVAAVLGEPTDLAQIEIAHKGNIFLKVTTRGDSGHASQPINLKKHAVGKMVGVAQKMKALGDAWAKEYKDPILGSPTVGLFTSIVAGDSEHPNKFPDTCVATFDIRTTPRLHDQVMVQVTSVLKGLATVATISPPVPCGHTDRHESIVQLFRGVTHAPITCSFSSNDLAFFTAAGIPGVVFGPGEPRVMHQPNEYCSIKNIDACVGMYEKVIGAFAQGKNSK